MVWVESLGEKEMDEETVSKLLDSTRDLIRMGFNDEAKAIRSRIDAYANLSVSLNKKFSNIDAGFKLLARTFSERGLLNRKGRQVNFSSKTSELKILLFLSRNTIKEANQAFRKIRIGLGEVDRELVKINLVFVDDGGSEVAKNKMIRIAAQEKVGMLILDLNTAEGKAFAKRFPAQSTPITVILKNDVKIIAIDPPGEQVSEIVFRNKS